MAKPIMIQGTMSNVGKSILAGGLCRVLKQDGVKACLLYTSRQEQDRSRNHF